MGTDRGVLAGELINDVERFHLAAINGVIELEIQGPQRVRTDQRHRTDMHTNPGKAFAFRP